MNYSIYKLNAKEKLKYYSIFTCIDALFALLFYDSPLAFICLLFFLPVYMKRKRTELCIKRKEVLKKQFCEMIEILSTSLVAGMSVENALHECRREISKVYPDDAPIVLELDEIIKKTGVSVPLSISLNDFSRRCGDEDINDFVVIFNEASRSGGNLTEIIKSTTDVIQDKQHVHEEISAMLNGKMIEQKVMCVIPFLIISYLRISSNEYIGILYHNFSGVIVMTTCLIIYVASFLIAEKIVDIKV